MKKNALLYLLIFSVLINIFQFFNATRMLNAKDKDNSTIKNNLKISRDSVMHLQMANKFSIENDEDAQEYFYSKGLDYNKVVAKVNDELVSFNENKAGNKLIPYEPIDGKPFLINSAKILNHRWIIAEFSNGDLWGQILVKYFVSEDKPTEFETVETILYEKQRVEK